MAKLIDGKLYVSSYFNGIPNCPIDINHYDSMDNKTDARTEETYITGGYAPDSYTDGSSYSAIVAIYKDNGDLTDWSNSVALG